MNQYQNTTSGQGLLKDFYGPSDQMRNPLAEALKRRRMRLLETRLGVIPQMEEIDLEQEALKKQRGL